MLKKIEQILERMMFNSRWLLVVFYLGLILAIVALIVKFVQEIIHIVPNVLKVEEGKLVLMLLTLVDLSLVGNLLLMVVFAGYENFVSKIDVAEHVDKPEWMGKLDFSGLKIKLIASIVAISGIELLKSFVDITKEVTDRELAWKLGIHLTFVVSGVLLAWMDKIAEGVHQSKHNQNKHDKKEGH